GPAHLQGRSAYPPVYSWSGRVGTRRGAGQPGPPGRRSAHRGGALTQAVGARAENSRSLLGQNLLRSSTLLRACHGGVGERMRLTVENGMEASRHQAHGKRRGEVGVGVLHVGGELNAPVTRTLI